MTNRIIFDVKVTAVHCHHHHLFHYQVRVLLLGVAAAATFRLSLVFMAAARYSSVCGNIVAGIFIQSSETIPNCAH